MRHVRQQSEHFVSEVAALTAGKMGEEEDVTDPDESVTADSWVPKNAAVVCRSAMFDTRGGPSKGNFKPSTGSGFGLVDACLDGRQVCVVSSSIGTAEKFVLAQEIQKCQKKMENLRPSIMKLIRSAKH